MRPSRAFLLLLALASPTLSLAESAVPAPLSVNASVSPGPSLTPTPDDAAFAEGAVLVRARRLEPQISERVLSGREARQVPGAAEDIVRALAALPGAVTANDFLANLLVRGGGFDDNLILLDGVPAAYPFHFGGLESVFHPGLLQEAIFLPGAFDVRFGDTLGGVLDLSTRHPQPGVHGEAGLSAIQASALLSVAGPALSVQGSYRRGWLDLVLPPDPAFVGLPRWQDYHAQLSLPLQGGELEWLAFGSRDSLVAKGGPGSSDSRFDSAFDATGFHWRSGPGDWRLELRGSADRSDVAVDLGPDLTLRRQPYAFSAALEAERKAGDDHAVDLGAQWQQTNTLLQGDFARLPVELGSGVDFNSLSHTAIDALGRKGVSSVWAQDRWQLLPTAAMSLGARFDQVDISSEFHFSPRWSLELGPFGQTVLRAAVGDYFQSPSELETVPGWSPIAARSSLVRNYTVGLQQGLGRAELRVEAYHKDFEHRFPDVSVPTGITGSGNVTLNAASTGWAEGAEALLRVRAWGPFSGWLSYAWSSVLRSSGQGGYYDADFSQPHVGNLVLQAALPRHWTLGGRWRLASGIPYTPVLSRSVDSASGRWTPVFGATNSQRLPLYDRLDFRLEKRWDAEASWWRSVTAYVELINALDAENITSVTYEDDYSGIRRIRQFPRLVFGGLELAF